MPAGTSSCLAIPIQMFSVNRHLLTYKHSCSTAGHHAHNLVPESEGKRVVLDVPSRISKHWAGANESPFDGGGECRVKCMPNFSTEICATFGHSHYVSYVEPDCFFNLLFISDLVLMV